MNQTLKKTQMFEKFIHEKQICREQNCFFTKSKNMKRILRKISNLEKLLNFYYLTKLNQATIHF